MHVLYNLSELSIVLCLNLPEIGDRDKSLRQVQFTQLEATNFIK